MNKKVYELSKGQMLVIPRNSAHSFFSNSSNDEDACLFWITSFYDTVHFHTSQYKQKCILLNAGDTIKGIRPDYIIEALSELKKGNAENLKAASIYLSSFIYLFKRRISILDMDHLEDWNDNLTKYIKEYISDNMQGKLMLKDIAEHIFLSPNYLGYKFKQETGITIVEYINQERIAKAKNLLKTTFFQLSEISELCGFENQFYFSKVFKKATGLSPTQYRKDHNKKM